MGGEKTNKERFAKNQFVEQKLKLYLDTVGVSSLDGLDEDKTKVIFSKAIQEFLKEDISLDDLASVSGKLWWSAVERGKKFDKKFLEILHVAGELSFYIRQVLYEKVDQIFLSNLKEVLSFTHEEKNSRKGK